MAVSNQLDNCPLGTSCSYQMPPYFPGDATTPWTCPPGTFIVSIEVASETAGPKPDKALATLQNVVCSDGSTQSGYAGYPTPSQYCWTASCANTGDGGTGASTGIVPPALVGFNEDYSTDDSGAVWSLTPYCADGTQLQPPSCPSGADCTTPCQGACSTPFFAGSSTILGQQTCDYTTHLLTSITANSSYQETIDGQSVHTNATAITLTCTPISQFCIGDNLNSPLCQKYCSANSSAAVCDEALKTYCNQVANYTNPICGCALPDSQYPLLNIPSYTGVPPPVACDQRCQSTNAIPLSTTGSCNVGVICIQEGINITAINSTIGQGITLSQNCNQTTGGVSSESLTSFFSSTSGLVTIIAIVVLILGIIIAILIASANTKKRQQELKDQQLRDEREQARLDELRRLGPVVLNIS